MNAYGSSGSSTEEIKTCIWDTEQEILDAVDLFCRCHALRYSLAYGSLLGAVRHKGFIPWDDDIDIMMPREDYDRLIDIWRENPPEGFLLQNAEADKDIVNNFLKIRKDHTTFIQFDEERDKPYSKGIYIDVFPGDRQAPGKIAKKLQRANFLLNLLYNRGYTSRQRGILAFGERLLIIIIPKNSRRKLSIWFGKRSRRWNDCNTDIIFPCTAASSKKTYPADLFEGMQEIVFCGKRYSSVRDTDRYLTIAYGDYMQLPPENERVWRHHPILVDFFRNYEEIPENER